MKVLITFSTLVLILLSSCYYDSKEFLYPTLNSACTDTISPVVFEGAIFKILNENCTSCHSGALPKGNILLDTYANVKVQVDNGQLLGSILHTGEYTGTKAMPQGYILSDCSIQSIKIWIGNQSPKN